MQISDKIAYLRKRKGWSQEQLASKLDVSRQAVYKWEANMTYPEIDKLKKLAIMFDISFNDFFDDNVDITKKEENPTDSKEESQGKEDGNIEKSQSNEKKSPQLAEPSSKKPELTPEVRKERNAKITVITALIVGIVACIVIAIWAFVAITSKNTNNSYVKPPISSGNNGDSENEDGSDGETEYCKVTCKVLGEFYSTESVVRGSTYEPEFLGVDGYTFEGWLHGSELWDVDNSKVTRDIILIAILTPKMNTVIFHANDGTSNKWEREFETGTGVLIAGPDYIRDGYTFKGYSLTNDGDELIAVGDSYTVKAGINTLYAIWEKKGDEAPAIAYNIKYNLAGGENSPFNPSTYSGTEPVLLKAPTKEFYSFVGWYSDSLYKNKVTQIENITKDTTFFAKWDYVGYTIMLNASTNSCVLERVDPNYEGSFDIPSEAHGGYPVTNLGAEAFFGCSKITEIYIPSTINSIEATTFLGTDSLAYIDVDDYNNSFCTYNGDLYIKARTRLVRYATGKTAESFILPVGCTYVNNYAFYGSKNLKSVDISETSGKGEFALAECGSIENVKIGQILNFIGANAFKKCGLTELTVEGDIYSIGNFAFSECPNLLKLTFNGNIGEIGWSAFKQNPSLISVIFNGNVEKLSTNLFEDCAKLKSISLPQGIKLINKYMFKNCSNLVSVSIPESVTLIEDGAFTSCYSLERISLHLGISEIQGSPFDLCSKLTIYCDASSKPSGWDNNWNVYNCPVKWEQEGEAGLYEGLAFIEKPDGTISVGTSTDVENVIIPEAINGKRVTEILAESFKNNTILKTVTIYAKNITVGLYAFEGCSALESVYVTDLDAWLSIDFQDNTANPLSNGVDLYIGGLMEYEKLTTLAIPTYIDTVKRYAFYGCTSLESAEFHENVVSLGEGCFKNCTSLKEVIFAEGVISVGSYMFSGCNQLETVNLSTTIQTLGGYAFENCSSLKNITLPDGLITINRSVFGGCTALTEIFIPISVATIGNSVFNDTSDSLIIKCEAESQPDGWSYYVLSNKTVLWGQKREDS